MRLTIKLDEINYGDIAIKSMPLLGQSAQSYPGAVGMTMDAIAQLPEMLIRDIFDAIPVEQKNEIISSFAMEHKDRILHVTNVLSERHGIGVTFADCSVDRELSIVAEVREIDYRCIVDRFLPVIREKLLAMSGMAAFMLRPVIQIAPVDQILGLLDRFTGSRDAFFASLINQNQQGLISAIEGAAEKQNIRMKIKSVHMEV